MLGATTSPTDHEPKPQIRVSPKTTPISASTTLTKRLTHENPQQQIQVVPYWFLGK